VIVTVDEPTVRVPLRARLLFAATVNDTEPVPVPPAPEVTVIHPALAADVQGQSLSVDTLIDPLPPVWL
jgi:hypothetical protein